MEIRLIKDKKTWEDFVLKQKENSFLQSWNWGEFHKKMGDKIWRAGLFEKSRILGGSFFTLISARRARFLHFPYGPLINWRKENQFRALLDYATSIGKKEKVSFIRMSPQVEDSSEIRAFFRKFGLRPAPIHMHAEVSWLLDIEPSQETLLKNMRKATRYSIRKAEKQGVQVVITQKIRDLEIFNKMYQALGKRQKFTPFSWQYLKNEFLSFYQDDQIALFLAKYKGEPVAGAVVLFYGKAAFYHHGASSPGLKIPASHLVLWQAILEAKKRGFKTFNFWGIAPTDNPHHPWQGLTFFKKGFGGYRKDLLHAQDLPLNSRYFLNFIIETFRKKKRRL